MLNVGISTCDVTPPVGFHLHGHASRKEPSRRIHDPLQLKVMTLFDGRTRLAIVTADLIGYSQDFVSQLRQEVKAQSGLPPDCLMLTASHTHTGPCLNPESSLMPRDQIVDAYIETVRLKICGGIREAIDREEPAVLSWGTGETDIGIINRRLLRDGQVHFGPNPDGPVDHDVSALVVQSPEGERRAILFHYACHPTTLFHTIAEISGDYPGVAQRALERLYPGTTAMFVNGCCGDVRPALIEGEDFGPGGFPDIERLGTLLAAEVAQAVERAQPLAEAPLKAALRPHSLRFDTARMPTNKDEVDQLAATYTEENQEYAKWIEEWRQTLHQKLEQGESLPSMIRAELQAFSIGDLQLLALPAEVMVGLGLRLKQEIGGKLAIIGYANHEIGYLPTAEAIRQGGYEAIWFIWEGWAAPFAETIEDNLLKATHDMVQRFRSSE